MAGGSKSIAAMQFVSNVISSFYAFGELGLGIKTLMLSSGLIWHQGCIL